ncbi:MAG: DEDD exonuclease domain-containing protein [Propionibacteriaceae bacterium]|jgi:DNA polymerase-3 subunit epsilon|nr:DEDD exonuclease domain-containing protein [Propionibacteriaceae bacterium]
MVRNGRLTVAGEARCVTDFADDLLPAQSSIDDVDRPLDQVLFCVIDLETTGTGPEARITEIGAVKVQGGEILGQFQTLVNPEMPIPEFITSLTGITNEQVADAPTIAAVFPSLMEFCRGAVMVAHNARFDMGFIERAAKALNYAWPAPVVVDTVGLARRIIPRSEVANYKLGTLAAHFSTTVEPSHRALDDVLATVDVLHALIGRVGNQGVTSLHQLLEYSQTVSRARRSHRDWAEQVPTGPGVYFFVRDGDRGRTVLYVGTSKQLRRRVASYFTAAESRQRMDEMVTLATGVEAVACHTALEAAVVELRLISAHQPPYNRRSKQPRSCWIKLTAEPVPRFSIVRACLPDEASYLGPFSGRAAAEQSLMLLWEAFPLRRCTKRLNLKTVTPDCALAQLGQCGAPCQLSGLDDYRATVDAARHCFGGDIRALRHVAQARIAELSDQERYEQAGEVLERWQVSAKAFRRGARLASLAACPEIVAARPVDDGYEIHVIRHGLLAGATVARLGDDILAIADQLRLTARTIDQTDAGQAPPLETAAIEEAELVARWLESPDVRLLAIDGVWGWPIHCQ